MSAYDTSTNSPSISFTNAYGTAICKMSAVDQYVRGFSRNDLKRYFEFKVDEDGSDHSKLWMGALDHSGAGGWGLAVGGHSQKCLIGTNLLRPGTTIGVANATPGTGAIFGIGVNFSGDGISLNGPVVATTSDGHGNLMLPIVYDFYKNNAFTHTLVTWDWPAGGFPKRAEPFLYRLSNSASDALVSLRVVTTSFAYAIPTNYIAWGDGPAGFTGVAPGADDATILWDNANKGAGTRMSLSGGNAFAVAQGTGEFPTTGYVMSLNLAGLTGKRYIEFIAGSNTTTWCADNNGSWDLGLLESTNVTLTSFATLSDALIHQQGSSFYKHGAAFPVASLTSVHSNAIGGALSEGCIIGGVVIDFDNRLCWFMNQSASSGTNRYAWTGLKTAATWTGERASPFTWGAVGPAKGIPISITASAGQVLRFVSTLRMDYFHSPQPISLKINASGPFYGYPLLPGVRSMNGGRSVQAGWGDSWDATNNPASATYGASGLIIQPRYQGAAQCAQTKFAGKKYFEIYCEGDSPTTGGTWDWSVGLRRDTATTLTWGATPVPANVLDNAIMAYLGWNNNNSKIARYNVTISWSTTLSLASVNLFTMSPVIGVAVDFDAGRMWFGRWNPLTFSMFYSAAGDPATGANPHATFTASTTMRIFMTFGMFGGALATLPVHRFILVQDDNNLFARPTGFDSWAGAASVSLTVTPSGTTSAIGGAGGNIWPFGITN